MGAGRRNIATTRVGINDFGHIGRNFFHAVLGQGVGIEIVTANDLTDNKTLAHLPKHNSITGRFQGEASYDDEGTVVDGKHIKALAQRNPADPPWGELGVKVVIESAGSFTGGEKAKTHLDGGTKKVVISVPAKNVDGTFAMGVNETDYNNATVNIVSNASCTTNCLAPLAKILEGSFSIKHDTIAATRSYTGDQRVLDTPHLDLRRVRAVALNMIPTRAGAAQAVVLIPPVLKDKLDGFVACVPTSTGSLTDLIFITKNEVSVKAVKAVVKAVVGGKLRGVLKHIEDPIVSSDIVGDSYTSVFDTTGAKVIDNLIKVLSWYDSEWDYSDALVRFTALIGSKLA